MALVAHYSVICGQSQPSAARKKQTPPQKTKYLDFPSSRWYNFSVAIYFAQPGGRRTG
jgi:hypothetical protein